MFQFFKDAKDAVKGLFSAKEPERKDEIAPPPPSWSSWQEKKLRKKNAKWHEQKPERDKRDAEVRNKYQFPKRHGS